MESFVQLRDNQVLIAHGKLSGILDFKKPSIMYFCNWNKFPFLYPATLKSAGYYVIPSFQKIAVERLSVCTSIRQRIVFTLSWEHFLTIFFFKLYMRVDSGNECPGIADG